MANLTIRNVEDETVQALKRRAKANRRSVEEELRQILADAVRPTASIDLRVLAEQIAAMTSDVPQTDSVDLLHRDRRR